MTQYEDSAFGIIKKMQHLGYASRLTPEENMQIWNDAEAAQKERERRDADMRRLGLNQRQHFPFSSAVIAHKVEPNYLRGWTSDGRDPEEIDGDEPYPPPDIFRQYKPDGPLGEAITRRVAAEHGEGADWSLIEQEEEIGYSEYTMESDYSYTIAVEAEGAEFRHEFDDMADIIQWLTE